MMKKLKICYLNVHVLCVVRLPMGRGTGTENDEKSRYLGALVVFSLAREKSGRVPAETAATGCARAWPRESFDRLQLAFAVANGDGVEFRDQIAQI